MEVYKLDKLFTHEAECVFERGSNVKCLKCKVSVEASTYPGHNCVVELRKLFMTNCVSGN